MKAVLYVFVCAGLCRCLCLSRVFSVFRVCCFFSSTAICSNVPDPFLVLNNSVEVVVVVAEAKSILGPIKPGTYGRHMAMYHPPSLTLSYYGSDTPIYATLSNEQQRGQRRRAHDAVKGRWMPSMRKSDSCVPIATSSLPREYCVTCLKQL